VVDVSGDVAVLAFSCFALGVSTWSMLASRRAWLTIKATTDPRAGFLPVPGAGSTSGDSTPPADAHGGSAAPPPTFREQPGGTS
jgi:hypothetical protein